MDLKIAYGLSIWPQNNRIVLEFIYVSESPGIQYSILVAAKNSIILYPRGLEKALACGRDTMLGYLS